MSGVLGKYSMVGILGGHYSMSGVLGKYSMVGILGGHYSMSGAHVLGDSIQRMVS